MGNVNWELILIYALLTAAFMLELHFMLKNKKASRWNKAKGLVLSSATELGGSTSTLKANIQYVYWINEEEIKSDKVAFATLDTWFALFKGMYVKVGETEVYYNPSNPKESVLVPGIRLFHLLDMILILGSGLVLQNFIGAG